MHMNCPFAFPKVLCFHSNGLDTGLFVYLDMCQNLKFESIKVRASKYQRMNIAAGCFHGLCISMEEEQDILTAGYSLKTKNIFQKTNIL